MYFFLDTIHPIQMIWWITSFGVLCMLVFAYIIRPINEKHKISNQYEQLMSDKNAICVILVVSVSGVENISNPCYVIAYKDNLKLVTTNATNITITIPFDKIESYNLATKFNDFGQLTEKKKIDFYTNSVKFLDLFFNDQVVNNTIFFNMLSLQMPIHDEPRAFNKYALTQNNFFDYIACKIPEQSKNIQL